MIEFVQSILLLMVGIAAILAGIAIMLPSMAYVFAIIFLFRKSINKALGVFNGRGKDNRED